MLRIVICEDDIEMASHIKRILAELYGETSTIRSIYDMDSLVELLKERDSADVLLLDIELQDYNSIEIVKKHFHPHNPLQIVYISGYIHYCTEVYDTTHISFLHKPFTDEQLKKAVDKAIQTGEQQRQDCLAVKINNELHLIPFHDLIYIESTARLLKYQTHTVEKISYGKLVVVLQQLPSHFFQCHKSYIVNLKRINCFTGNSFTMGNGESVPISQALRKTARERFFDYVEGKPWNPK